MLFNEDNLAALGAAWETKLGKLVWMPEYIRDIRNMYSSYRGLGYITMEDYINDLKRLDEKPSSRGWSLRFEYRGKEYVEFARRWLFERKLENVLNSVKDEV